MNKTINELINTQKSDLNILGAPERKWSTFGNLKTLSSYVNSQLRSCLLYTSPSPRDLSTSRMPSSA